MKTKTVLCLPFAFCLMGCDELIHKDKEQPKTELSHLLQSNLPQRPAKKSDLYFLLSPAPSLNLQLRWTRNRESFARRILGKTTVKPQRDCPCVLTCLVRHRLLVRVRTRHTGDSHIDSMERSGLGAQQLRNTTKKGRNWSLGVRDQYDPLNLFSKEEKAKRTLKEEQIRGVADQFGVTYAEAWEDAKAQGYIVPPKH